MSDAGTDGYVLDASAVLAFLNEEPGADLVESVLARSVMSSVNVSEVLKKVVEGDLWEPGLERDLEWLGVRIDPFGMIDARLSAAIWEVAPAAGLSLGDRACLALAHRLDLPTVTTDRAWFDLDLSIQVIDARDTLALSP